MVGKRKPEILAPAGELKSVIGAIAAGADAVYLGAPSFSARAYAKNLSTEEIIEAIRYAHLWERKIYLALNTLLKDNELEEAIRLLIPLYEAGLDAVIVQDLGLLSLLSENFPGMEIHASTQMAILSTEGIRFLKAHGVSRVVPGRELMLSEIKRLKEEGLEIECFVHGAMCYSYSGKCLFSSLAGGRSGNRGRCAGPCRKEYTSENGKKGYFLSMKDMCSLSMLPELMEAGVDSLKIEGRMKSPEYSAGVTSVYRKYVDLYAAKQKWEVDSKDLNFLKNLYIRSEIQEGYLKKYNGKDMISLNSPSYRSMKEDLQEIIQKKYLAEKKRVEVSMQVSVFSNQAVEATAIYGQCHVSVAGVTALPAEKRALAKEDIEKQMKKTGNTPFVVKCTVETDGISFVPVSALNELRREVLERLTETLLPGRTYTGSYYQENTSLDAVALKKRTAPQNISDEAVDTETQVNLNLDEKTATYTSQNNVRIGIKTKSQYEVVTENRLPNVQGLILPLFLASQLNLDKAVTQKKEIYLRLPEVIREGKIKVIEEVIEKVKKRYSFQEIYCPSLDAVMLAKKHWPEADLIADAGIYVFNQRTEEFLLSYCKRYTASYELNEKELNRAGYPNLREMVIYGYLPLMYSANCMVQTLGQCNKKAEGCIIIDEKHRKFPVMTDHELCTNILYNFVPLSLMEDVEPTKGGSGGYRLEFTVENAKETEAILDCFCNRKKGAKMKNSGKNEFTRGHFRRGVE